jgi:hypothetical protein
MTVVAYRALRPNPELGKQQPMLLSQEQVREILQDKCTAFGMEEVTKRFGVSAPHLNEVLQGLRLPNHNLCRALGLQRIIKG